jgi:hypothetical protein
MNPGKNEVQNNGQDLLNKITMRYISKKEIIYQKMI